MTEKNIHLTYTSFRFTALTFKGTVLKHALPKAIFFTCWAALITGLTCANPSNPIANLAVSNSLIAVLGGFISLLLVFRTNTAYDRYWEGRRIWSTMTTAIRTMARVIWVNASEKEQNDVLMKRVIIDLLGGFSFSVKHYLREEYGLEYEDMKCIKRHIPNIHAPSSITPNVVDLPYGRPSLDLKAIAIDHDPNNAPNNIPIALTYNISAYIAHQATHNKITAPTQTLLLNTLNSLTDCLTGFERILRTPIPIAYSVHLSQSLWIFCLALPFQLLSMLGPKTSVAWATIPFTTISTFVLFGILNIGEEIENPFGYDENDLPLDDYCFTLRQELIASTYLPVKYEDCFAMIQASPHPPHDGKTAY
ncbi:UPF0187-domain-containing protein [Conidiobolus coronatus NRRL 28638]|uniref:UPF0187-domain-containing protein n=1 Tax=Conidiobolus coronatus (strain ATCC 28846 / CBS 209.66 / NRRL 28638) TaxID=796925 RepID=A0A137PAC1_CONC2|nr:UPF0187-domain-containing protein [Conidiobolus coronatus NRRL 28638]|eukprot:KXN71957.1 UPF0187-domain-containing protein [Conidiobolus coronatus NRRL 28638]